MYETLSPHENTSTEHSGIGFAWLVLVCALLGLWVWYKEASKPIFLAGVDNVNCSLYSGEVHKEPFSDSSFSVKTISFQNGDIGIVNERNYLPVPALDGHSSQSIAGLTFTSISQADNYRSGEMIATDKQGRKLYFVYGDDKPLIRRLINSHAQQRSCETTFSLWESENGSTGFEWE